MNEHGNKREDPIQTVTLQAGHVSVELCNVGASITKLLVHGTDIVLGYDSPQDLYQCGNPFYMCAIVGRVANRIAHGSFQLYQESDITAKTVDETQKDVNIKYTDEKSEERTGILEHYHLDTNNGPHHLHGGYHGYHTRIWDLEIISEEEEGIGENKKCSNHSSPTKRGPFQRTQKVKFNLFSPDGDQGYPGALLISATYSLRQMQNDHIVLSLHLSAQLLPCSAHGQKKATPINLVQHSYFNLRGHNASEGILDHILSMPQSIAYLPVDETLIPTRDVIPLEQDTVMDFRSGKRIRTALTSLAKATFRRSDGEEDEIVQAVIASRGSKSDWKPFGFDHCYVLATDTDRNDSSDTSFCQVQHPILPMRLFGNGMHIAAILEHPMSRYRLTIYTDAPAVQVYSGHYLSPMEHFKDRMNYTTWSGICLETQYYPDSIFPSNFSINDCNSSSMFDNQEFLKGRCPILVPGICEQYNHNIEYHFSDILK